MKRSILIITAAFTICVVIFTLVRELPDRLHLGESEPRTNPGQAIIQLDSPAVPHPLDSEDDFDEGDIEELMDELLGSPPTEMTDKVILFAGIDGSEMIEVEGREIIEDPITGVITVTGFTTMSWPDGRSRRAHGPPDPKLWFYPETGEVNISVNYLSVVEQ